MRRRTRGTTGHNAVAGTGRLPPAYGMSRALSAAANRTDARPAGGTTDDFLLGGRVKYTQPRGGFRAAIDPVLLAAAIPARPGERVLEGGTGAGAALLCLAARVPNLTGLGIDRDVALLGLAQANAAANGQSGLLFAAGDLAASPVLGCFDHAFANPPYLAAAGTASPSPAREAAKRAVPGQLSLWVAALSRPLRHRGTLTLIVPPRLLAELLDAMRAAEVAADCVFPIWPKSGEPARLMLVRGRKHGRSPLVLANGLILHTETGAYRPEAELILRAAGAIDLG